MQFLILNLVASAYGEGNYGDCAYNEACTATDTSGGAGGAGSGLADTGVWVVALVTLACLIIFIALLARWLARRNSSDKKSNTKGTPTKSARHKK